MIFNGFFLMGIIMNMKRINGSDWVRKVLSLSVFVISLLVVNFGGFCD